MSLAAAASPIVERRRAPRRQPAMGTVCRIEAPDGEEEAPVGLVWNISTSGISLLYPKSVSPDAVLRGELRTMNHDAPLPIVMRVAHVSQLATGDYVIGCQFERALTADEMTPFVA